MFYLQKLCIFFTKPVISPFLSNWLFGKMTTQLKTICGYHGYCAIMVKHEWHMLIFQLPGNQVSLYQISSFWCSLNANCMKLLKMNYKYGVNHVDFW